jgi:2-oxoglutarate dehydrogenase complex dehydrogenase (E1) component-like enzyme
VVLTPKSFLRLPAARSRAAEFEEGNFQRVLDDPRNPKSSEVKRVLLSSGKFYYDLAAHRDENEVEDVALVRVEQLYPFPAEEIAEVLGRYPDAEVIWAQEEPENMGAWRFVSMRLIQDLDRRIRGIHRRESASPATGSLTAHQWEQGRLIEAAFA